MLVLITDKGREQSTLANKLAVDQEGLMEHKDAPTYSIEYCKKKKIENDRNIEEKYRGSRSTEYPISIACCDKFTHLIWKNGTQCNLCCKQRFTHVKVKEGCDPD